jgi:hypothetical protein
MRLLRNPQITNSQDRDEFGKIDIYGYYQAAKLQESRELRP